MTTKHTWRKALFSKNVLTIERKTWTHETKHTKDERLARWLLYSEWARNIIILYLITMSDLIITRWLSHCFIVFFVYCNNLQRKNHKMNYFPLSWANIQIFGGVGNFGMWMPSMLASSVGCIRAILVDISSISENGIQNFIK